MVFGMKLRLPTTDYVVDLGDQPHGIHHYAQQHLKVAGDRMKARYDRLATSAVLQEGDKLWSCPDQSKFTQAPVPDKAITRMNDVDFRIQQHPNAKIVVHLDRLAPYLGPALDKERKRLSSVKDLWTAAT
jgi:hypothetical protein